MSSIAYRNNIKYNALYAIMLSPENNNLLYLESRITSFSSDGKQKESTGLTIIHHLIKSHATPHP